MYLILEALILRLIDFNVEALVQESFYVMRDTIATDCPPAGGAIHEI